MKGFIISHHCINSRLGKSDIGYFTEQYSRYVDKATSSSPMESKEKVELNFESFDETIVFYSVLCGKLKRPITVFGTEHGDRVYVPEMQSDFEKLLAKHKGQSKYPTWYANL